MSSYRVGLMLYSVRDACAADLEGTLREVAALGYEGVEIFDLHGHAPETVADWLDELGLVAIARHSSLEGIESRLPELAAEARALGWERLVVSWVDPANLNDETIDRLALAATAVSSAGLELGYHNHDAEVEQGFLDRLPHGVFLELDAGWAWYAGVDPVDAGRSGAARAHQGPAQAGRALVLRGGRRRGRLRALRTGRGRGGCRVADRRAGRERRLPDRGRTTFVRGAATHARGGRVKVGVIGCGVISRQYVKNAEAFDSFELVACADLDPAQSIALAKTSGLATATVDELIEDPSIDVVLNLTPAPVHAAVIAQAMAAGKHVYTEKPVATDVGEALALVREAERRGLRIGCAPDIFLGSAYQAGRAAIESGAIGEPLSVSAAMLVGGQETWHPNPDIFYVDGAGPLFDMGPYYLTAIAALLGSIVRVTGFASTRERERTILLGPRVGERFRPSTPTHTISSMQLASGALANLVASFEVSEQYICDLTIHGTEGVLTLPDPNSFAGTVRLKQGRGGWEDVPYTSRGGRDARGIGLHDMVEAIAAGTPHRASGLLGAHIVEVVRGILQAADEGRVVEIESRIAVPEPLPVDAAHPDAARS